MLTSVPSRDTWMWPWSVGMLLPVTLVWVAGTTLPPMRFTTSVTSGPVVWLGVGCVIWMRTGDAGCSGVDLVVDLAPPHPVAVTAMASTAGRARRVFLADIVEPFSPGGNSTRASARETATVLAASAFEQGRR